jgi:DMSO/TMAO reductase YedYZ molybdopterin-dependent catalytic subunit
MATTTMAGVSSPEVRLRKGFGAGAGAGLVVIIAMTLAGALGLQSIPELLQGALLRLVPGDLFEFMVHTFKGGAKVLLIVSVLEGLLLVGGGLGWLFVRQWRPAAGTRGLAALLGQRYPAGVLYGLAVGLGLVVLLLLLFASGFMNPQPSSNILLPQSLAMLVYGLVYGLSLVSLLVWPGTREAEAPEPVDADRRGFMRMLGGTVLALVAGAGLWGVLSLRSPEPDAAELVEGTVGPAGTAVPVAGDDATVTAEIGTAIAQSRGPDATNTPAGQAPGATNTAVPATNAPAATNTSGPTAVAQGPDATSTSVPATSTSAPTTVAQAPPSPTGTPFPAVPVLPPEITPTANFYITTKNYNDPNVNGASWSLQIMGRVAKPMTLTLDQIKALPSVQVFHTLECISNTVGGDLIGNGFWKGIRIADLVKQAGPQAGVVDAVFRAADDYSDSVPLAALLQPDAVLAYEMNGKPLTLKHGYPARLLIPGIFGMKNVKWLQSIELVNYDYSGFWQSQGWSDPAPYLTMSRIDYPTSTAVKQKPLYIGGVAFAGNRGISRVEVSVDGGKTWGDAQLRRALSRNAWVLWTYPWIPQQTGDTTLVVRATDGTGQVQSAQDANNYPDGATGYHRVAVKVVGA